MSDSVARGTPILTPSESSTAGPEAVLSHRVKGACWTVAEEASLVEYIVERGFKSWPKAKAKELWEGASLFLEEKGHKPKRTIGSCRARVVMKLANQFSSPLDARSALAATMAAAAVTFSPHQRSIYSPVPIQCCTLKDGALVEHHSEGVEGDSNRHQRSMYSPVTIEYCDTSSVNNNSAPPSSNEIMLGSGQQSSTFSGEEVMVRVLSTHEVVDYVIPSFSVITVELRRVRATFGTSGEELDVFLNANGSVPDRAPFFLRVSNQCTVEVSEFSKSVDVSALNTVGGRVVVLWEWTVLQLNDQ